ncbi:tetratricopeptide repeat protein [Prochlorothrix hollandica]|uniref:tetratricopeptide repeat protein n=1 Tax=Prochlorothrix hollandica TaxID=1223 RepID=UPI00034B9B6F|nr:tetratricopeptide repeat protein [Prochlorothrix hollandica]
MTDAIQHVTALDDRLRQLENYLGKQQQIKTWRQTLEPPDAAWWWKPLHPSDRWDWLWSALTLVALTGNLALVTDLAPRFLTGGPSLFGSLGAIVPAVLTLLGGSSLTDAGRQLLERGLERLGLAEHWWHEVKCGSSWLVLLLLVGFKSQLPLLAEWYTDQGRAAWKARNLTTAQEQLERALALAEDQPEAQFYLGRVYDDFQQKERAIVEYEKAWQAGYLPASNNLAVLYMEDAEIPRLGVNNQGQVIVEPVDYEAVVRLLQTALEDPSLSQEEPELEYALRKNLGQIRINQERYAEAEVQLQRAIDLQVSNPDMTRRSSAYCLLAELRERLEQPAREAWNFCLQNFNASEPKADEWAYKAGKRLAEEIRKTDPPTSSLSPTPTPTVPAPPLPYPSPAPFRPASLRPAAPVIPATPLAPSPPPLPRGKFSSCNPVGPPGSVGSTSVSPSSTAHSIVFRLFRFLSAIFHHDFEAFWGFCLILGSITLGRFRAGSDRPARYPCG